MKAKLLRKVREKYHIGIIDRPESVMYHRYVIVSRKPADTGRKTVNKEFGHIGDFFYEIEIPGVDMPYLYMRNRMRHRESRRIKFLEKERLNKIKELESQ